MPLALCETVAEGGEWRPAAAPAEALLADPDLLEDEVWRLFTVPDAAWAVHRLEDRMWCYGKHPAAGKTWAESLATLAGQGHLDRDRLIGACLGAFTRDFAPTRVGWYAEVHAQLSPSLPEMAAHSGSCLALLGANSVPGVKIGQQAAGRLLDAGLLDPCQFLAACVPALLFPRKNIALAQLKLIGKLMRKHPEATDAALTVDRLLA